MPKISKKGTLMPESPIRKLVPFAEEAKKSDETGPSAEKSESEADSGTAQIDPEPLAEEDQADDESSDPGTSVAETEKKSGSEEEPEKTEKMVADEATG